MKDEISIKQEEQSDKIYAVMNRFNKDFTRLGYAFDDDYLKSYSKKILSKGIFVTANYKESIVGFFCGYLNPKEKCAYISFLAVKDSMGILKGFTLMKLLKAGMDIMKENGIVHARLEVRSDNEKARKLYEKLGFFYGEPASENSIFMNIEYSEFEKAMDSLLKQSHRRMKGRICS